MSHVYLLCLYLAALLIALNANGDLLSPSKLYLYTLGCSWATIFYEKQEISTDLAFVLMIVPLIPAIVIENRSVIRRRVKDRQRLIPQPVAGAFKFDCLFWLATVIPVSAMAWLVIHMGGLTGYRLALAARAAKFEGQGWLHSAAITIGPLNCCYLAMVLCCGKRPNRHLPYALNFLLASTVLAATGARVNLIEFLIVVLGVRHYIGKRLRPATLIGLALVCSMALVSISVFRMNQRGMDFSTPLTRYESHAATGFFNYGPESTSIILNATSLSPKYGSTYLAVITNIIPRAWWRDKPDQGGKMFTLELLGDPNRGASNINPTYLAEGMFNFGIIWGALFAVITLSLAMAAVVRRYIVLTMYSTGKPASPLSVAMYMYIAICVSEATFGDFSTVFGKLMLVSAVVWPTAVVCKRNLAGARPQQAAMRSYRPSELLLRGIPGPHPATALGPSFMRQQSRWK